MEWEAKEAKKEDFLCPPAKMRGKAKAVRLPSFSARWGRPVLYDWGAVWSVVPEAMGICCGQRPCPWFVLAACVVERGVAYHRLWRKSPPWRPIAMALPSEIGCNGLRFREVGVCPSFVWRKFPSFYLSRLWKTMGEKSNSIRRQVTFYLEL